MAKKITELPSATTVEPIDVLPMVDLTGPTTQKVTITQLANAMNGLVATLTGSTFSGPITAASSGITGSITRTTAGTPFVTVPAGNVVTVSTGSNGQIVISGSVTGFMPLAGGTFTGAVTAVANGGITGSITVTSAGTPFITVPAGNGISITTGSNGQIILSGSSGGSGSGAPTDVQYLTLATNATLTGERVFVPGTGLKATDGGANGNYTLNVNDGVVATLSGSTFTGAITAVTNGGITGSITRLVDGTPFITVPVGNVVTVTTGSGGQIIFSGSGGANQGAPRGAQFLALATDAELSAERVFTPSTGLKATDAGAGGAYTVSVHDGTFAALTGSVFTGAVSHDSGGVVAATIGSDIFAYFSGSCGLTGSNVNVNATRKATVFAGDLMMSGTIVEQRPMQAPKAYYLQHNSQSVITAAGPTTVLIIERVPSGAFGVDVAAAATHATPSTGAGYFKCSAAFVNNNGTLTQLGAIGGVATGTFGGSGASTWGLALDASNNTVRLRISGSSATSTWAWWLTAVGGSP